MVSSQLGLSACGQNRGAAPTHGAAGGGRSNLAAPIDEVGQGDAGEQQRAGGTDLGGGGVEWLTGEGLPMAATLGGRRPIVGGRTLGRCRRLVGQEASQGRCEALGGRSGGGLNWSCPIHSEVPSGA
jgi:hypothetical protein